MYKKGDKVVYPMYGAGVIEELETKMIDGNENIYYVMRIPIGNLKIMISVKNAENLGIRPIMSPNDLIASISRINSIPVKMHDNWNQRYKDNMEKIKSGNLSDVVEVFRNLRLREKERSLSSAEKKVLSSAKQIVLSEIILSFGVEKPEAEEILNKSISY